MSGIRVRLRGVPVGRRTAAGPARLLEDTAKGETRRDPAGSGDEARRLADAFAAAERELQAFPVDLPGRTLMDAQRAMLSDPLLRAACETRLGRGMGAPAAVRDAVEELASALDGPSAPWPARGDDLRDLGARIARALGAPARLDLSAACAGEVAVAAELLPSEVATLARTGVSGFATERGHPESHAALLAEALGMAGLVGVVGLLAEARAGERVALDPWAGEVRLGGRGGPPRSRREAAGSGNPVTRDGVEIELAASAGSPAEVERARAGGAAGVDLYRTELGWMGRGGEFEIEAAALDYRRAIEAAGGIGLVLRTLDLGADKEVPGRPSRPGRGLARWLAEPDLARRQAQALARALDPGVEAEVRLLLPRVEARSELEAAARLLAVGGVGLGAGLGVMIESPAGVEAVQELAPRAAWLALGTSDLAAALGGPGDEGMLRPGLVDALRRVVAAARAAGVGLVACGRLAAHPVGIALLLGLGVRRLAVPASSLGTIRAIAASMDIGVLESRCGSDRRVEAAELAAGFGAPEG